MAIENRSWFYLALFTFAACGDGAPSDASIEDYNNDQQFADEFVDDDDNYQPSDGELEQWRLEEEGFATVNSTGDGPLSGFEGGVGIMGFRPSGTRLWQAAVTLAPDEETSARFQIVISTTEEQTSGRLRVARYPMVDARPFSGNQRPEFDVFSTFSLEGEEHFDLIQAYETVDGFVEFTDIEDIAGSYEKIGNSIESGQQLVEGRFQVVLQHRDNASTIEISGNFRRHVGWQRMLP